MRTEDILLLQADTAIIALGIKAAELITGEKSPISPEYWDYQVKSKYQINSVNSITMLLFGHKDFIRVLIKESMLEEGSDPLLGDAKLKYDIYRIARRLYLDSKFSNDFSNRLIVFQQSTRIHIIILIYLLESTDGQRIIIIIAKPWVFGLKG